MAENSEDVGLTEVAIIDPIIAEQNEVIAQLVQQIAELKVEMQKNRDLSNLAITANTPSDGVYAFSFPHQNPVTEHTLNNPPAIPIQKTPIINLTTPNPNHASSSQQTPPPPNPNNVQAFPSTQNRSSSKNQAFPPPQNTYPDNPQTFPHIYHTLDQYMPNLPST